jgi:hypothetical protein
MRTNGIKITAMVILSALIITVPSLANEGLGQLSASSTYSIKGYVFDSSGSPIVGPFMGPPTTIKIVELNQSAMPTAGGYYEFTDISTGTYTIRAYFGSIDHSTIYRNLKIYDNRIMNWTHGKTWITGSVLDSSLGKVTPPFMGPPTTIKNVYSDVSVQPDENGNYELSNIPVGGYVKVRAYFGSIDHTTNYIMIKAEGNTPNDIDFINGRNSVYGYVFDVDGTTPLPGETVNAGPADTDTKTNNDGFYLLSNLPTNADQTITVTFNSKNNEIAQEVITMGPGDLNHLNFTFGLILPDTPVFITESSVEPAGDYTVRWNAASMADEYVLLEDGIQIYQGTALEKSIAGKVPGTYEYTLIAGNANGNSAVSDPIQVTVMGGSSEDDLWVPGMEWEFHVESTSTGSTDIDIVKYTVLSKETKEDLAGTTHDVYKVRRSWESESDTISYMWFDAVNLDKISGDTDYGAYNSQMSYSWVYSSAPRPLTVGAQIELDYSAVINVSVPGHPLITRGSTNIFKVEGMVNVTVPFGTFACYNITITDKDDGIVSWNYYYSDEIRHWVKMVDRLSDGMSDMVVYTLKDTSIPTKPVITTESGEVTGREVAIEWAEYPQALGYVLYENDVKVYDGTGMSHTSIGLDNGVYEYVLKARLSTGSTEPSKTVRITVNFTLPSPGFITEAKIVNTGDYDIEWNTVEDAESYVLYEDDEEIFSGTETAFSVTGKEDGLFRYRVKAISSTHGESPLSDSLLVTVELEVDEEEGLPIAVIVAIVITFGVIILIAYFVYGRER